jgi:hypothetical protein
MKHNEKMVSTLPLNVGVYQPAYRRGNSNELGPLSRPRQLDTEVLMISGVVAFIAFLGIAAVGLYAGMVTQALLQ